MAKGNTKGMESATMTEAIEKANKEAGYDVALAFATLSALRLNEQVRMDISLADMQADVVVMADIVNRASGGEINSRELEVLLEACVAYGWHWRDKGESLLQSETAGKELLAYVDGRKDVTAEAKMWRKESVSKGLTAVADAVGVIKEMMEGVSRG